MPPPAYSCTKAAFIYSDQDSGRVIAISGYPTDKLTDTAQSGNIKYVWLAFLGAHYVFVCAASTVAARDRENDEVVR